MAGYDTHPSRGVCWRPLACAIWLLAPLLPVTAEEPSGRFGGIGLRLAPRVGVVEVDAVAVGGPADKAGVQPGDWITEIDGQAIRSEAINDVVARLRGATGTVVKVVFVTVAGTGRREAALTRRIIDPDTITWRLPGGVVVTPDKQAIIPPPPVTPAPP